MKSLLASLMILALLPQYIFSGPPTRELRKNTPCGWESLFRNASMGCPPCGPTRGIVLYSVGAFPRVKAHLQGTIWKGKTFYGDATFTNRWLGGITAGSASIHVESSWIDGRECHVIQTDSSALVFRNIRDELRQIAPGLWLGISYDSSTGRMKNWFVLSS